MAEQFKSITDARKELPSLAAAVESGSDRVVITNQGKPQAVLLGYDDFRGLLAAVEFMNRPDDLARLREGLADTSRMSFGQLREWIAARRAEKSTPDESSTAAAPVAVSAVDQVGEQLSALHDNLKRILEQAEHGLQAAEALPAEWRELASSRKAATGARAESVLRRAVRQASAMAAEK